MLAQGCILQWGLLIGVQLSANRALLLAGLGLAWLHCLDVPAGPSVPCRTYMLLKITHLAAAAVSDVLCDSPEAHRWIKAPSEPSVAAQKGIGYPKDINPSRQEFLSLGESHWAIPGK